MRTALTSEQRSLNAFSTTNHTMSGGVNAALYGDVNQRALTKRVASRRKPIFPTAAFLVFSAWTTPTTFFDPQRDFRTSGTESAGFLFRIRVGRRISLTEARAIAMAIFTKAEHQRHDYIDRENRRLLIDDADEV